MPRSSCPISPSNAAELLRPSPPTGGISSLTSASWRTGASPSSRPTPGVVESYVAFLSATKRPSSTARALAAVRGLHRFCVDERGAPADPTEGISTPRIPQAIPKALTEAEVELLLSAVSRRGRTGSP